MVSKTTSRLTCQLSVLLYLSALRPVYSDLYHRAHSSGQNKMDGHPERKHKACDVGSRRQSVSS